VRVLPRRVVNRAGTIIPRPEWRASISPSQWSWRRGESRAIPVYRNAAVLIRAKVPGDYYEISIGFRATGGAALQRVGGGLTL